MGKFLQQLGEAATGSIPGAILGLTLGGFNDARQMRQQEDLQDLQIKGQKEMTDYQMMKQLEMWRNTSYGPQVEEMKKAGINPALLYGMSGGGGQTTGSASGTVQGGHAPTGGREIQDMIGMGMQMKLLEAQKANIEADTELKKTDAQYKAGVQTDIGRTQIADLLQGINSKVAQQKLTEVQTNIAKLDERLKGETMEDMIEIIEWNVQREEQVVNQLRMQNEITKDTMTDVIKKIHGEMLGVYIHNATMNSQIKVNEAQMKKWAEEIAMGWQGLDIKENEVVINKFKAEFEAQNPGVLKQASGWFNDFIDGMRKIMGKTTRPGRKIDLPNK